MVLIHIGLVAIGAGFGGLCRAYIRKKYTHTSMFPLGTLFANVLGCFMIGLILALVVDKRLDQEMNVLLATGFCGGLTTFSTFILELYQGYTKGNSRMITIYGCVSLLVCMISIYLGYGLFAGF